MNALSFQDLIRTPDAVVVQTDDGWLTLEHEEDGFAGRDITVRPIVRGSEIAFEVSASQTPIQRIHIRWRGASPGRFVLGDGWERGYGDLEWRGIVGERPLPWYFLTTNGQEAHGYGVKTGAGALCFWRVDPAGVSLWLDVRSGGLGVKLGDRTLSAATVRTREGQPGETPFTSAQALCRLLCDNPRRPDAPIYGSNNWYYAYGNSSHEEILGDTEILTSLSPDGGNRPFMVIDAGWHPTPRTADVTCEGPWDRGNARFPDMPRLASEMRERGARAGIWIRPLSASYQDPDSRLLPPQRALRPDSHDLEPTLDPSLPENLERITADFACLAGWGYEMIKHDFSTFDSLGRWGFDMGAEPTSAGWAFADRSRTTAEILLDLYRAMRRGAGSALLLGCNTMGHLGAGLFEIQRTGDDTSGRAWERTRKMGINTLAFRMPQQGAFFDVDADCVGLTQAIPWAQNRQWLDLLARSGTPLFVSADPRALGPEHKTALRQAFQTASIPQPVAEPLDWLETTCPARWKFGTEVVTYDWYGEGGIAPALPEP